MLNEQLIIEDRIFYLSKKVEILNWLVVKESSNDTIASELDEIQKDINSIRRYFLTAAVAGTAKSGE